MSTLETSARMTVRPGQLEGFKRQAAECIRRTKESHARILRSDWFLSDDATECEVREAYPDPHAMVEHHAQLGDAVETLFARYAADHQATLYGEPPPELAARLATGQMQGPVTWCSFFQGLAPEPGAATGRTEGAEGQVPFEVGAHMTVRPGQLAGWRDQAAELMRLTRERDTRTLRYDWYLSQDGTQCGVREAYLNEAGLIEHNEHIMEARATLFRDFADDHRMTVYSAASPRLIGLMNRHAGGAKWFSFLLGLEPVPTVLIDGRAAHRAPAGAR
jgi:quinol monooxygenase YgiN